MQYNIYLDEAGRGPLAGPVFVGMMIKLADFSVIGFQDSKQLSPVRREQEWRKILLLEKEQKLLFAVGDTSNQEIDQYGIISSLKLAIIRGWYQLIIKYYYLILKNKFHNSSDGYELIWYLELEKLLIPTKFNLSGFRNLISHFHKKIKLKSLIVDGNHDFGLTQDLGINVTTIIKGDQKVPYISLASIIAKVNRDQYMIGISDNYLNYDFALHKGYGTRKHLAAIKQFGISPLHRLSYLKNYLNDLQLPIYQPIQNFIISSQQINIQIIKPKLLLHICCITDMLRPEKLLDPYFDIYYYWYNPNITDQNEFLRRLTDIKQHHIALNTEKLIINKFENNEFTNKLFQYQNKIGLKITDKGLFIQEIGKLPEKSIRCQLCIYLRLLQTAITASQLNIKYYTTTLTTSPRKDINAIYQAAMNVEHQIPNIIFLKINFKINNGYQISSGIADKMKYYKQKYCGCSWSK